MTTIDYPLSAGEQDALDYLRRAIAHAPIDPGKMAPDLSGWFAGPDRQWYVCARCAGRIMARGCHLPRPAEPVWADQPRGVCCLCE